MIDSADKDLLSEMMHLGQTPYLGKFNTCAELGQRIAQLRTEIDIGNKVAITDLWRIFAPTCDWDNAGGSPEIADAIYMLVYR